MAGKFKAANAAKIQVIGNGSLISLYDKGELFHPVERHGEKAAEIVRKYLYLSGWSDFYPLCHCMTSPPRCGGDKNLATFGGNASPCLPHEVGGCHAVTEGAGKAARKRRRGR